MSAHTYISGVWAGRLVDQVGQRAWDGPEEYTGLAKLTATLKCLTSEAENLRPALGDPHPNFPRMLCDERSIRETESDAGVTSFVADYYGLRQASDETRIFQPRVRPLFAADQQIRLGIRHLHLGVNLNLPWIAMLRLPRPQEMGDELQRFTLANPYAVENLRLYEPRLFTLRRRVATQYGPFVVFDDEWSTFTWTVAVPSGATAAAVRSAVREFILMANGEIPGDLQLIDYAGCTQLDSFENRLIQRAYLMSFRAPTHSYELAQSPAA
jgi:hypothetical protein